MSSQHDPEDHIEMSSKQQPQQYHFSTGRGGRGNIQTSSAQPQPNIVEQGSLTPNLLQPVFSTGRGGAGNMHRNTDAKFARKLQDVDAEPEDYITPVISGQNGQNNAMSFGRGGFGNMISPKNSYNEDQTKQREKPPSDSKGGFFSRAKKLFKK
jgi:hypothetical protein